MRRNIALRKVPYIHLGWLSRVEQFDADLARLLEEAHALCRERPLGRSFAWCHELLAAGIAVNEARERLQAMMLADGWDVSFERGLEDEVAVNRLN